MNNKQMITVVFFMLGLIIAGCAQVTTRVRQEDDTYRTSKRLVFSSDLPSRSFSSEGDDMVATEFHNVTYLFPKGTGNFSKNFNKIDFEGHQLKCSIVGRELKVNYSSCGELKKGDLVRITSEGRVLVNDVERKPIGDN